MFLVGDRALEPLLKLLGFLGGDISLGVLLIILPVVLGGGDRSLGWPNILPSFLGGDRPLEPPVKLLVFLDGERALGVPLILPAFLGGDISLGWLNILPALLGGDRSL